MSARDLEERGLGLDEWPADSSSRPLRPLTPEAAAVIVVVAVISMLLALTLGRSRSATAPAAQGDSIAESLKSSQDRPAPENFVLWDEDDGTRLDDPGFRVDAEETIALEPAIIPAAPEKDEAEQAPPAQFKDDGELVSPDASTHRIRSGDTYESVAAHHYGRPELAWALYLANPGKPPKKLQVGDVLRLIPLPSKPLSRPAPHLAPSWHRVRKGEVLGRIAREHYGRASLWTRIYAANRGTLSDPDRIRSGMRLRIP